MLYTRNGWQEILSDDNKTKSHMIIFMSENENGWTEIADLFPEINNIIKRNNLTGSTDLGMASGMLTIAFHDRENEKLPDSYKQACGELLTLINPGNK